MIRAPFHAPSHIYQKISHRLMNFLAHLKDFDTWQLSKKNPKDALRRRTLRNIFLDDSLMRRTASLGAIFLHHPSVTFGHPRDQNEDANLLMV